MKRSILSLMFILVLLLFSAAGLAQDMSEGDLVYPFQYADLDAYAAATGNSMRVVRRDSGYTMDMVQHWTSSPASQSLTGVLISLLLPQTPPELSQTFRSI